MRKSANKLEFRKKVGITEYELEFRKKVSITEYVFVPHQSMDL